MTIRLTVETHELGQIELTAPEIFHSAGEDSRIAVADAAQGLVDKVIALLGLAKAEDPELATIRAKAAAYDAIAEHAAEAAPEADVEAEVAELRAKLEAPAE
jgi:hypothetical protein